MNAKIAKINSTRKFVGLQYMMLLLVTYTFSNIIFNRITLAHERWDIHLHLGADHLICGGWAMVFPL